MTDVATRTRAYWTKPIYHFGTEATLPRGERWVQVQPGNPDLPPLDFAVDGIQVRAEWRLGNGEGSARVTLQVRLKLGNGALCATRGTLPLHTLVEVPKWLDRMIDKALAPTGQTFRVV
jgi:hypothetical protein